MCTSPASRSNALTSSPNSRRSPNSRAPSTARVSPSAPTAPSRAFRARTWRASIARHGDGRPRCTRCSRRELFTVPVACTRPAASRRRTWFAEVPGPARGARSRQKTRTRSPRLKASTRAASSRGTERTASRIRRAGIPCPGIVSAVISLPRSRSRSGAPSMRASNSSSRVPDTPNVAVMRRSASLHAHPCSATPAANAAALSRGTTTALRRERRARPNARSATRPADSGLGCAPPQAAPASSAAAIGAIGATRSAGGVTSGGRRGR